MARRSASLAFCQSAISSKDRPQPVQYLAFGFNLQICKQGDGVLERDDMA
jgi:hypothetical protein